MSARHFKAAARTLGETSEQRWKTQAKRADRGTRLSLSEPSGTRSSFSLNINLAKTSRLKSLLLGFSLWANLRIHLVVECSREGESRVDVVKVEEAGEEGEAFE